MMAELKTHLLVEPSLEAVRVRVVTAEVTVSLRPAEPSASLFDNWLQVLSIVACCLLPTCSWTVRVALVDSWRVESGEWGSHRGVCDVLPDLVVLALARSCRYEVQVSSGCDMRHET